jgi:hypothetical protein
LRGNERTAKEQVSLVLNRVYKEVRRLIVLERVRTVDVASSVARLTFRPIDDLHSNKFAERVVLHVRLQGRASRLFSRQTERLLSLARPSSRCRNKVSNANYSDFSVLEPQFYGCK